MRLARSLIGGGGKNTFGATIRFAVVAFRLHRYVPNTVRFRRGMTFAFPDVSTIAVAAA